MEKITALGGISISGSYIEGHPYVHNKACQISDHRNQNNHPNPSHEAYDIIPQNRNHGSLIPLPAHDVFGPQHIFWLKVRVQYQAISDCYPIRQLVRSLISKGCIMNPRTRFTPNLTVEILKEKGICNTVRIQLLSTPYCTPGLNRKMSFTFRGRHQNFFGGSCLFILFRPEYKYFL